MRDVEWFEQRIAFIDTETTGLDPKTERIVEIGIVIGERGEVIARYDWLVNPGVPIPQKATEIHGICDADVAGLPSFAEVMREVLSCLWDAIPGAYNAGFDRSFVLAEVERTGIRIVTPPPALNEAIDWLDPLVFAREFNTGAKRNTLKVVAERYGIAPDRSHRATDDAETALRVLYAMASDKRVPMTYAALMQEQRAFAEKQQAERALQSARKVNV